MKPRGALLTFGVIFALRPGCGPYHPDKPKKQEAQKLPEHCLEGSDPCYVGCYTRQEGQMCTSCCFEHLILCGDGKPHDFKKCDTIERETRKP